MGLAGERIFRKRWIPRICRFSEGYHGACLGCAGVYLEWKAVGDTSHAVVRRYLAEQPAGTRQLKVMHGGALDPLRRGCCPSSSGRWCAASRCSTRCPKVYRATVAWGTETHRRRQGPGGRQRGATGGTTNSSTRCCGNSSAGATRSPGVQQPAHRRGSGRGRRRGVVRQSRSRPAACISTGHRGARMGKEQAKPNRVSRRVLRARWPATSAARTRQRRAPAQPDSGEHRRVDQAARRSQLRSTRSTRRSPGSRGPRADRRRAGPPPRRGDVPRSKKPVERPGAFLSLRK